MKHYLLSGIMLVAFTTSSLLWAQSPAPDCPPQITQADAFKDKGRALMEKQAYKDAIQAFTEALKFEPDYKDVLMDRGRALMELGRFQEAKADFTKLAEMDTGNALAQIKIGDACFELKETDSALAAYQQALAVAPDNALGYERLYGLYDNNQQWEPAAKLIADGLKILPENLNLRLFHADILMKTGKREEAVVVLKKLAERPDAPTKLFLNLATALRADDASAAHEYALKAYERDNGSLAALLLADENLDNGNTDKAAGYLKTLRPDAASSKDIVFARLRLDVGRSDRGALSGHLEQAKQLDPRNPEWMLKLAYVIEPLERDTARKLASRAQALYEETGDANGVEKAKGSLRKFERPADAP